MSSVMYFMFIVFHLFIIYIKTEERILWKIRNQVQTVTGDARIPSSKYVDQKIIITEI